MIKFRIPKCKMFVSVQRLNHAEFVERALSNAVFVMKLVIRSALFQSSSGVAFLDVIRTENAEEKKWTVFLWALNLTCCHLIGIKLFFTNTLCNGPAMRVNHIKARAIFSLVLLHSWLCSTQIETSLILTHQSSLQTQGPLTRIPVGYTMSDFQQGKQGVLLL